MLILGQFSISAQNKANIKSQKNANGELQFELQIENQSLQLDKYENWIKSTGHSISGDIVLINSKEFICEGKSLINLSKKPSTFQTEILFTLGITQNSTGTKYVIKDICFKSLPEYGKQGTPALFTNCSDWFSDKNLYKKSGKMRSINEQLLNNSTKFAEELLLSFSK
jgi:hypothetical protein